MQDTNTMKRNLFKNFFLCGCIGWCLECLYTGLGALQTHKDRKLICTTSLWMFPIYGMAALICPVGKLCSKANVVIRGGVYTICIFIAEYVSGTLLGKIGACPWDYSKAKYNYKGVIRFDYSPLWFIVGLLFEHFLIPTPKEEE